MNERPTGGSPTPTRRPAPLALASHERGVERDGRDVERIPEAHGLPAPQQATFAPLLMRGK